MPDTANKSQGHGQFFMEYMEKKFIKLKEQAPELSENDLYKFQFLLVRLKAVEIGEKLG